MSPIELPANELKALLILTLHRAQDGSCCPPISSLARHGKMARGTLYKALAALEKRGWISRERGNITLTTPSVLEQMCSKTEQMCSRKSVQKLNTFTSGTEDAKSSTAVHCSSVVHCSTPVFKTTAKASTPLPPTGGCLFEQKNNSFPQARPSYPKPRRRRMDPFATIPADATYEPPTSEQVSEAQRLLELWNKTFPATVRRSCNQILDQNTLIRLLKQDYTSQQVESVIAYLRKETRVRFWPRPANLLHQTRQGMVAIDKILMDIDLDPKISDWDRLSEQEKRDKFYLNFGPEHFKHFSPEEKQCVLDARARKAAREGVAA